ncbi:hypothetical protein [Micromonospora sp. NPDC049662]|uniref:hypothetical protein n=1 Tax=Micromonospora sp. NPDC049662 TaxID=3155397 RepID=UPI00341F013D
MLARLRRFRTVICPDCKGAGHIGAPADWQKWSRTRATVAADYERLAAARDAGEASDDDVAAASSTLANQMLNAPGGDCETCCGHGIKPLQRKRIGRPVRSSSSRAARRTSSGRRAA